MSPMRHALFILLFVIIACPVMAEMFDPTEVDVTENVITTGSAGASAPYQIRDMVQDPTLADTQHAAATRRSVSEAAWKALLFPGWGHFYLEHYNKAGLILGAQAVILVGVINSDPEKYVNANSELLDAVYQQRQTLGMLGGLIWLWSIFDAAGIAIENNRMIEEEEKKFSLYYDNALRVAWVGRW